MEARVTAADVKDALRRRHPAIETNGFVGAWTVLEEWERIDLLAISAWASCRPYPRFARVGYEVKVSRADYRRELARPHKRAPAVAFCHEFYFAVPHGLLKPEEIAWVPPWGFGDETMPLERHRCEGTHGASCFDGRVRFGHGRSFPHLRNYDLARTYAGPCPTCRGAGWTAESPAKRAGAPSLWVPDDVGLVVVSPTGRNTIARKAPRRQPAGQLTDAQLANLVRWVSVRPDPRHASAK